MDEDRILLTALISGYDGMWVFSGNGVAREDGPLFILSCRPIGVFPVQVSFDVEFLEELLLVVCEHLVKEASGPIRFSPDDGHGFAVHHFFGGAASIRLDGEAFSRKGVSGDDCETESHEADVRYQGFGFGIPIVDGDKGAFERIKSSLGVESDMLSVVFHGGMMHVRIRCCQSFSIHRAKRRNSDMGSILPVDIDMILKKSS